MSARETRDDRATGIRTPLVALLASVLGLAVYSNAFGNAFQLDDLHSIRDNPYVRSLAHVPRYFTDARTFTRFLPNADYRPVLQTTYALDYAIAGYAPWVWHATNLALHVLVSVGIFLLGRRLIGALRLVEAPFSRATGELASALGAALFVVHPLAGAAVNYVSTRSSVLVAAFLVPATVLWLRSLGERSRGSYAGAIALYVLALLTKAEAISFLAVAALAEVVLRPRGSALDVPWRTRALRLAPLALLALGYLALRRVVVPPEFAHFAGSELTSLQYLMTQTHAWWSYASHVVWPVGLVADRMSYPVSRTFDARVAAAWIGWALVAVVLWRARRTFPQAAFLVGAFLLHLAPTSSVMPLTDMVNEHRPYLPSAGLFVLVGLGVVALARGRVKPALVITGVLALALGALTHARNRVFATEETFWTEIVAKEPRSVRALVNLGVVRLQQRDLASAEALFRRALELEPSYLFARLNLGAVLGELRRPREALAELDEAVRLAPTLADPYYARGTVRAKLGDLHGALADMKLAVERAPVPTRELKQMWEILDALGRREEARKVAQRGFALDPQLFGPLLRR